MSRGALLLLLCFLTMLLGLGRTAIVDSDEAYYAAAGREIVVGGDWITPHYNFEERLNKPILYYWLVAGTYKAIGVTELAARVWAALSGVGLALVTYAVGRRWASREAGLVAGAIVATSVGVVVLIRQALPDMPLALFISLTIWAAIEAASTRPVRAGDAGDPSRAQRRRWLVLAAASMGLGMMTKGPIAVALPVMALAPLLVWERFSRDGRSSRTSLSLTAGDVLLAVVVFVLIAAPWYVLATRAHGLEFLRQFFIGENLDRFASDRFNERREPGFYLGVMAAGLLPWTVFALFWIAPVRDVLLRRRDVSPATARLVAWVAGPLLILSASVGSQPRYILPCIIPVAVLLGRSMWQRATAVTRGRDVLFTTATLLAGGTLAVFGILVWRARPLLVDVNPDWSPAGAFTMIAAGLVVGGAAFLAPRRVVAGILAAGSAATAIAFSATVLRANRPEPVEVIAAAMRAQEPPADAVCACGAFARSLTFYTHTPVYVAGDDNNDIRDFLLRPGTVLAAADSVRLEAVESALQRKFPRIAEVAYLNPGMWQQPGTALLNPDPTKYLQRVILVSNR